MREYDNTGSLNFDEHANKYFVNCIHRPKIQVYTCITQLASIDCSD